MSKGPRRVQRVVLAVIWFASMVVAFQLGGTTAPKEKNSSSAPGASTPEAGPRITESPPGKLPWNETRVRAVGNRFITFTETLDGDELARILPEITDKMSLAQVRATLTRLVENVDPGPTRRIARIELIRRWAQLDPKDSFAHIEQLDDPKMRHDLRLKGVEGWASVDPEGALVYALDADPELKSNLKKSVELGFATTRELDTAFAFLSTLASEDSPDPTWSVDEAVKALYRNDDLAVIHWIEGMKPSSLRDRALRSMLAQWTQHDPDAAAEWSAQHGYVSGHAPVPGVVD